jgi:RHS repeat-associated protein
MMLDSVIGNNAYVSSTLYDSAGRMTQRVLGNGLTQTYDYYDWNEQVNGVGQGGRLQNLLTGSLQDLNYVYDAVGNITSLTNVTASETNTYGYDALNRLTSWTLNSVTETYGYNASTGNLETKAGVTLTYNDAAHVHAVSSLSNGNTYQYDANGNQTTRVIGSDTYTMIYDAENRLIEVKKNSVTIAQFTFDGDGRRVKSIVNGVTTYFAGGHYELTGSTVTKYYFAGASRIATLAPGASAGVRKYTIPQSMSVEYMLGDHLGSTSITTDVNGAKVSEMRYKPWREVRYSWTSGVSTTPAYSLPKYTFTGQYSYMDDPSTSGVTEGFGLMFYNARWYDPYLNHFAQPDSIVSNPYNVQDWDRYAYGRNNPVRYTDPSGHVSCSSVAEEDCSYETMTAEEVRVET